jgi:hypothetical protein
VFFTITKTTTSSIPYTITNNPTTMYTRQQAISNQAASTETKKLKKLQDKTVQQQACIELLKLRDVNGGFGNGAFKTIIDKYKSKGFVCVTRRNL